MADEELHKTPTDGQVDEHGAAEKSNDESHVKNEKKPMDLAQAATYVENDEIPVGRIEEILDQTVDEKDMTPQMRRMMQRQRENTKRVEESIKGTKANPSWFVPVFCALMIIGLIWAVVFYLTNYTYPIPAIGSWNLLVAFGFMLAGFIMMVWWR
ncbi:cell division protein CrgA [Bifidobacterium choerinum]|uniref:Cell division protein CrgA n=1 Tax=Bifidobacterium choerinum TaxID=35760 RepID=A0A2D3D4F0_9BIFI|nr:cell division protein CrgA [Bifidobacterium choerinum]ATU20029.1 septation inhibitor protein [Bifidobacterium choerinum]